MSDSHMQLCFLKEPLRPRVAPTCFFVSYLTVRGGYFHPRYEVAWENSEIVCTCVCVCVYDGLVVWVCSGVGFGLQLDGGIVRRKAGGFGNSGEGV